MPTTTSTLRCSVGWFGALHERPAAAPWTGLAVHGGERRPTADERERQADIRLHQRRAAARLVIVDDQALIGSFSPLGDDGSRLGV